MSLFCILLIYIFFKFYFVKKILEVVLVVFKVSICVQGPCQHHFIYYDLTCLSASTLFSNLIFGHFY